MWVYRPESLEHRLRLDPILGFWLDHWLFLHADETHPIWCARPLGLRAVAEAGLASQSRHDHVLRTQLKRELPAVLRWAYYLPGVPTPPSDPISVSGQPWDALWLNWFEAVLSHLNLRDALANVAPAVAAALSQKDLRLVAYLNRRLAAELGGDEWTSRQLFMTAKRTLCDSGQYDDRSFDATSFAETVVSMFTGTPEQYAVTVHLAPVKLSRFAMDRMNRRSKTTGPELQVDKDEQGQRILQGLQYTIEATHPEHAAALALSAAIEAIEALKLQFYVITKPLGPLKVVNSLGTEVWLRLPEPFWPKQPAVRAVPGLPRSFNRIVRELTDDEQERWYAARWHLSLAFTDWSEDAHAAATEIWQALEAFAPEGPADRLRKVLTLIDPYLVILGRELAEFEASRISVQAGALKDLLEKEGKPLRWFYWASTKMTVDKWLRRVLDHRSHQHFAGWSPPAPLVAFADDVGLIHIAHQRMGNPAAHPWMESRLEGDLALLYGVRNKAVHRGSRVLPRRTAEYLARLGAEMIFTIMNGMGSPVRGTESDQTTV
jgi:hypothetical protein